MYVTETLRPLHEIREFTEGKCFYLQHFTFEITRAGTTAELTSAGQGKIHLKNATGFEKKSRYI